MRCRDREEIIAEVWRTLENQSVYFTGERRMGKTSILDKMRAYPVAGAVLVYIDVEELQRPGEFAAEVFERTTSALPALLRARGALRRWFKLRFGISKLGVGPVSVEFRTTAEARWPEVLDGIVDAIDHLDGDRQVVLCFDELPQFLANVSRAGYPLEARRVLDKLRGLRQTNARVRMIYTGSIGLHHIEAELREHGSSWAPTNDMKQIDVPPFAPADAIGLADVLLTNQRIETDDHAALANAIASATDGVPYFIHRAVDALIHATSPVTTSTIDDIVNAAIDDPDDSWGFRHFVNRVPEYYREQADIAYAVLDVVSQNRDLSFDDLMTRLPMHTELDARSANVVRATVNLLERDHYLSARSGRLRFQRSLLERAWRAQRYLT